MIEKNLKIIAPRKGWKLIDIKEIIAYKDLFYFMVWRDIKVLYKQTVLGFAWAILRPIFTMIVFSVIFGKLAKVPSDGIPYPIFSYAALIPWTYFSNAMTKSTTSLINAKSVISKIYYPRIIIPLTPVLAGLVDFLISFTVLIAMMIWYKITPTLNILFLPMLVILMMMTSAGIGMWLTALAIQYRDIQHISQFLTGVLMYTAPVAWPVSLIPDQYRLLYGLYPLAGVIEGFRSAIIGAKPMPWDLIVTGSISAVILFVTGAYYFRYKERIFADVA